MKISVVGVGDLTKISRYTPLKEKEVEILISDIAKLIAKKGHEIVIIPDRGIPIELAKIYKKNNGKTVYGVIPTKDKDYGVERWKPYHEFIDKKIEFDSWYDVDGKIASQGEICVCIGISPGVMRDITVLKYQWKYLNCKTKLIIFRNTISQPLMPEIEEEFKEHLFYISSVKELEKFL